MKLLKWFWFLSKRLYKKWMFVILICLVPLSVAALKVTSNQKSGFVQIAIVNLSGKTGEKIVEKLDSDRGIINFLIYDNSDDAISDLKADKLDSVWVLPEKIEERIAAFVQNPDSEHYIVNVIQKENSLKSRLAIEKLSGAVYPLISRPFFLKCVREDGDFNFDYLTDEQIYEYYDNFFNEGDLFRFAFPDNDDFAKSGEANYMTSPIRGLLSAVVILAGLAAALLYVSDEKKGVFSFVGSSRRLIISFAFELTAILNIGIFVFCSVFVLGVNTYFWREAVIFVIFSINSSLFCVVLCNLIKSITVLAPLTVLITIMDIYICPIFFDFYIQKTPQLFLPNAYYINSVHNNSYLKYSLVYTAVLLCITFCLYLRKRKE